MVNRFTHCARTSYPRCGIGDTGKKIEQTIYPHLLPRAYIHRALFAEGVV